MKLEFIKVPGGKLLPADDYTEEKMTKFQNGEQYPVEIKLYRNPQFHSKVFAFFNFCFEHWKSDREFMDESGQFDVFRKNMTVLAGYYNEYYKLDGSVRVEAKSLAYAAMTQDEFEDCYSALIQVAMKRIFDTADQNKYNQLLGFF